MVVTTAGNPAFRKNNTPLKIAIASGKGGTGKTIISTNLAYYLSKLGKTVQYLDCDVEEPNGHLFFHTDIINREDVTLAIPVVDPEKCDLCGACGSFCAFGAIALAGEQVLTFSQLCHSCGGCSLVCPQHAISETARSLGQTINASIKENPLLELRYGILNIGESMAVPVIKQVKHISSAADYMVIDCPPGTSCPVIESVTDADFVLLVTEPTPFGLNDLKLAVDMLGKLDLPFGIAINQIGLGDDRVQAYCRTENLSIVLEIPYSRKIAGFYSKGQLFLPELPEFNNLFENLIHLIEAVAA